MRPHSLALLPALLASLGAAQNQAISLSNGLDGHFDVPFDPALVPPTGITVEAWITYDDSTIPIGGPFVWPTIARQNTTPQLESWVFRVGAANTNNLNLEWKIRHQNGGLQTVVYQFVPGEFQSWTHVAATFDGTIMRIFKNGVEVVNRTVPLTEVQNLGGVLRVGNGDLSVPGAETWNGSIDEVRIWPVARAAAEIASTMNLELSLMPGKVITFNLNGSYIDSSLRLVGTPTSTNIAFTGNAPSLVPVAPQALNVGQSTSVCPRTLDTGITTLPAIGNQDFALFCANGPGSQTSSLGILVVSGGTTMLPSPTFLGVTLNVDLGQVLATILLVPPTNPVGMARIALPVPPSASLAGATLAAQFGFQDAACGPQGFTGSDAIAFILQ